MTVEYAKFLSNVYRKDRLIGLRLPRTFFVTGMDVHGGRRTNKGHAYLLTSACRGRDAPACLVLYLLIREEKKMMIIAVNFHMTLAAVASQRWVAPGIGIALPPKLS